MKYLITGGFGCIGSYVIRDLLKQAAEIVVYDLTYDLTIPRMVLTDKQLDKIEFVPGDITDASRKTCRRSNVFNALKCFFL